MQKIGLTLSTVYADLTQRVHARQVRPGSPFVMTVKGKEYLYAKRLVGRVRQNDYLGPADEPETKAIVERVRAARQQAQEDRKTIQLLKRAGIPAPASELGRVLDALSDAGLFADAVLIGTGAYQCYSPIVGYALPNASLTTGDADLAAARLAFAALPEDETLLDVLRRADPSFAPIPALSSPTAPSSAFRAADGFMVDLVTQQRTRHDPNPVPLKRLGAGATPLQFVKWLIARPLAAVALYGIGVPVTVPQPARFAVHKLMLAQERKDSQRLKRRKDLLQAQSLIEALRESDPYALGEALEDAREQGRGWSTRLGRSLAEIKLSLEDLVPA